MTFREWWAESFGIRQPARRSFSVIRPVGPAVVVESFPADRVKVTGR